VFQSVKWVCIRVANKFGIGREATIQPRALQYSLTVRTNRSSDPAVFDQIFVRKDYSFLDSLPGPVKLVIDLGANIGCASALFLTTFPHAFVLAVEPDPANFELCRRNLLSYGLRAKVILGAVWHSDGELVLSRGTFGAGNEWATEVRDRIADEKTDVACYSLVTLAAQCREPLIDLLKIDIEGSEIALFSQNTRAWLHMVRHICVELHGEECRAALLSALEDYDYQMSECGEYTLCLNLRARSPAKCL
jgi:FkbM family methyltransferase